MNAGTIWWGQIGNSLRLLSRVTDNLRDCRSAILQIPVNFPWRYDFYEAVDSRRSAFSGERRLVRLTWEENADPGEFILEELCSKRVRADYWPGKTYAEYLGARDDIVLNDYYVWITDVSTKADAARWVEFICQYERTAAERECRAVFIIEYDGARMDISGIDSIVYTLANYDCRVFCLELAAAGNNTDMHTYQAELALSLGGGDPQLCDTLIGLGENLLQDPVKATLKAFRGYPEQTAISAAWKAAIILLFPILEQRRIDFVTAHEAQLKRHLPITNSNGDRVTDPFDLEVGPLCHIIASASREFSAEEAEDLRQCRKVRNLLAHNKVVPYQDIRKLLME